VGKADRAAAVICSIPDCDSRNKRHYAFGWCQMHYKRWQKHGDPLIKLTTRRRAKRPPAERFWEKVNKHGPVPEYRPELGPCWLWSTPINAGGYGIFYVDGRTVLAHRWACQYFAGPIPDGLDPDHLCRVRACVKFMADEHGPAHLDLVTPLVNFLRGESPAALAVRTNHCQRGHPFDEANTYWTPGGKRRCRTCVQLRQLSRAAAGEAAGDPSPP
jgi:hypothetical protein